MQKRQEANERDRLSRLREAQLNARDPGESKIKGYDWKKHYAKPKPKPKPLVVELFDILPTRWKGAFFGVLFGAVLGAFLLFLLPTEWDLMAVVPVLICGIGGMVVGKVLQEDIPR